MCAVRILHTADTHFDSPMTGFSDKQARIRKEECRKTFENIMISAKENADIVLCAGDLFENSYVSSATLNFLKRCFALAGVPVFIAPGNHDFADGENPYTKFDFGENVHIFSDKIECVEIPEKNLRVYGCGFNERFIQTSLLSGFSAKDDGMINIMVTHGAIGAENEYNPVSVSDIEKSNLDYIAFGHTHTFSGIKRQGKTYYAYSGMPEGIYFDETDECGYIAGEVSKGVVKLDFIPSSIRKNRVIEVEISGSITYNDAAEKIKEKMSEKNDLYKVILTGTLGEDIYFDENLLKEALKDDCFFVKTQNNTSTIPECTGALWEEFSKRLTQSDEQTKLALSYGAAALAGKDIVC